MPSKRRSKRNPTSQRQNAPQISTQNNPQVQQPTQPLNILYFVDLSKDGIDETDVENVKSEITSLNNPILYLVIHTNGGDLYSSVRIIRLLQRKYSTLKILIPEKAFSAGTVMALGGNEIYMDQDSMLGPLDLPIEHPKDGSSISSLDITKVLSNIAVICSSTGMYLYRELRKDPKTRLGKKQAADIAFKTSNKILEPILSQIDPYILQRGYREQDIGYLYAYELLTSRLMANNSIQARLTCDALVNDYPSHGYGIFRDEANNKLKLNVKNLENLPEWTKISLDFAAYRKKTYKIKGAVIP